MPFVLQQEIVRSIWHKEGEQRNRSQEAGVETRITTEHLFSIT